MDPNATLDAIFQNLREGNLEEAGQLLDALETWIVMGGFGPDWVKALREAISYD